MFLKSEDLSPDQVREKADEMFIEDILNEGLLEHLRNCRMTKAAFMERIEFLMSCNDDSAAAEQILDEIASGEVESA